MRCLRDTCLREMLSTACNALACVFNSSNGLLLCGTVHLCCKRLRSATFQLSRLPQIVPMENEVGRAAVERGQLCERKNGRGVDTNRNWEVHWGFKETDYDPKEEFPGTRPFRRAPWSQGTIG